MPASPDSRRLDRGLRMCVAAAALVAVVVAVAVFVVTPRFRSSSAPPPAGSVPAAAVTPDPVGVGDPYFPGYGSPGWDAQSYSIAIEADPGSTQISGRTTIVAVASVPLASVYVDLALDITAAQLDGEPARTIRHGFSDVEVVGARPVAAGTRFTLTISYAGRPDELRQGEVMPFRRRGAEWLISGQPESSAWWFPADDHPSDRATVDLTVRVPPGVEAVSIGRLVDRATDPRTGTVAWHWRMEQPVAPYLVFLAVGQFELRQGTAGGRPFLYAVSRQLKPSDRAKAFAALAQTPAIIAEQEELYGPYPFSDLGGFVPAAQPEFSGLETQTRPVYRTDAILDRRYSRGLMVHELAHMWFGDNVTLAAWDDLFDNEAYACWTEWADEQRHGGPTTTAQLEDYYRQVNDPQFWTVTMNDPGRERLFSNVYARGPMTLEALRHVIGDAAFRRLNRGWAQQAGTRSLEQWMSRAQSVTPVDLTAFFAAWISGTTAPPQTPAYGFR